MIEGRELMIGGAAAGLAALAVAALWAPAWPPGWTSVALDMLAALALAALLGFAVAARIAAAKGRTERPSALGAVIIAVVFSLILVAFCASVLYAVTAKHGLYQPFLTPPGRLELLAFFLNEALAGALFDVLDVFELSVPGAPAYDPQARWGFALLVILIRFTAALGVWSLIFAAVAYGARTSRG